MSLAYKPLSCLIRPGKCATIGLLCLLLSQACSSQAAQTPILPFKTMSSMNLDRYQWKNRLLLIFAPSETNAAYQSQMQALEGKQADLDDRDLLLIKVLGDKVAVGEQQTDAATSLREQFGVDQADFRVILVGKDGTEKRREAAPIQPQVVFAQIDTMPMRQQEMHRQNH